MAASLTSGCAGLSSQVWVLWPQLGQMGLSPIMVRSVCSADHTEMASQ